MTKGGRNRRHNDDDAGEDDDDAIDDGLHGRKAHTALPQLSPVLA